MKRTQTVKVLDCGAIAAQCLHGLSPAVECLRNPFACPCGYAEGNSPPHYPVPAKLIRVQIGEWRVNTVGPMGEGFSFIENDLSEGPFWYSEEW